MRTFTRSANSPRRPLRRRADRPGPGLAHAQGQAVHPPDHPASGHPGRASRRHRRGHRAPAIPGRESARPEPRPQSPRSARDPARGRPGNAAKFFDVWKKLDRKKSLRWFKQRRKPGRPRRDPALTMAGSDTPVGTQGPLTCRAVSFAERDWRCDLKPPRLRLRASGRHRLAGLQGPAATVEALVALKMIRGGLQARPKFARFRIEAEAVARLHHPNIVQIYEIGEAAGSPLSRWNCWRGATLRTAWRANPSRAARRRS